MLINQRTENIIRLICTASIDNPMTAAIISDELNISVRSIQRELPFVEDWLKANGFQLVRKRSLGLYLDEPEDRIQELINLLNENTNTDTNIDNRNARQDIIRREILYSNEPLKAYYFAEKFKISEKTLANDLTLIAPWFESFDLKLIRKQGYGVYIEYEEFALRQAITSDIFSQLNYKDFKGGIRYPNINDKTPLNDLVGRNLVSKVTELLNKCEDLLHLQFTDNAYIHILIYLCYSTIRIKDNHVIDNQKTDTDIISEPSYAIAEYMMNHMVQYFNLPILLSEVNYLALYLNGFRIFPNEHDLTIKTDFDIHQITLTLIRCVSNDFNVDFINDKQLMKELVGHIRPTIGRIRAGIPIDNPLIDEFKKKNPQLFDSCIVGCEALSAAYGLPSFPINEIGFISIYFALALERKKLIDNQITVAIVCPTGIGSSRLLAENLKKEYPEINVFGNMSAFDLNEDELRENGVDLIVSTVKINTNYRWLNVNTFLTKQDKMLLDSKISLIKSEKNSSDYKIKKVKKPTISKADLEYIEDLGHEIYHLLSNIRIGVAPVLRSREEIINYSAALFADDEVMEKHFYAILKNRDLLGDTYMKPFYALLLHGASDKIDHPCFGYVKLEPPIYENGRIILGSIVSFIPKKDSTRINAPLLSQVIAILLENPKFLSHLRNTNDEKFKEILESALLKYYKDCVLQRLE